MLRTLVTLAATAASLLLASPATQAAHTHPAVRVAVSGNPQGPIGNALRSVLWRHEYGEMLADNLLCGIALETMGTGVPAHHMPIRIEHEDGVILDGGYQQLEALSLIEERFGCVFRSAH